MFLCVDVWTRRVAQHLRSAAYFSRSAVATWVMEAPAAPLALLALINPAQVVDFVCFSPSLPCPLSLSLKRWCVSLMCTKQGRWLVIVIIMCLSFFHIQIQKITNTHFHTHSNMHSPSNDDVSRWCTRNTKVFRVQSYMTTRTWLHRTYMANRTWLQSYMTKICHVRPVHETIYNTFDIRYTTRMTYVHVYTYIWQMHT